MRNLDAIVGDALRSTLQGVAPLDRPTDEEARHQRAQAAGHNLVECETCGHWATREVMRVIRPGQAPFERIQITCQRVKRRRDGTPYVKTVDGKPWGQPACDIVVIDRTIEEEPMQTESSPELPLCACGCGERVQRPGQKVTSRACNGRLTAMKRRRNREAKESQRRSTRSAP